MDQASGVTGQPAKSKLTTFLLVILVSCIVIVTGVIVFDVITFFNPTNSNNVAYATYIPKSAHGESFSFTYNPSWNTYVLDYLGPLGGIGVENMKGENKSNVRMIVIFYQPKLAGTATINTAINAALYPAIGREYDVMSLIASEKPYTNLSNPLFTPGNPSYVLASSASTSYISSIIVGEKHYAKVISFQSKGMAYLLLEQCDSPKWLPELARLENSFVTYYYTFLTSTPTPSIGSHS